MPRVVSTTLRNKLFINIYILISRNIFYCIKKVNQNEARKLCHICSSNVFVDTTLDVTYLFYSFIFNYFLKR